MDSSHMAFPDSKWHCYFRHSNGETTRVVTSNRVW